MKKQTMSRKKRRGLFIEKGKLMASKLKSVAMVNLKPFPPNCNPFRHDLWRMGTDINDRFLVMFDDHDGRSDHLIVIEKSTGRRVRITFQKEV